MVRHWERVFLVGLVAVFLGFVGLGKARSENNPAGITISCQQGTGFCSGSDSCDFGTLTVPLKTTGCTFAITNNSGVDTRVTSFSFAGSQFQVIYGLAPWGLNNGDTAFYTLIFAPTRAGPATGTLTVNVKGSAPITATVTGTGATTTAVATLSETAIDFGNVTQGVTSAGKEVTITNTGSEAFTVDTITADPPFFTSTTEQATIQPGSSSSFEVYFQPSVPGTFTNTLTLVYDSLPVQGIDLTGVGTAARKLELTTFQILPVLTQGAAYYAQMNAAGGTPPYTWALQTGSQLPQGLTMSSSGVISGTVVPTAKTGDHFFTVQVTDSANPPATVSEAITAEVDKATGAACNNISWDVTGTDTLMEGLDVLGTGTYEGYEAGLYPHGSNTMPPGHLNDGLSFAKEIQPLDQFGNPDPDGKEVLLVVGESITFLEGQYVDRDGNADPAKNPSLVIVNGGQGGATQGLLKDRQSAYWTTMMKYLIPNYGVYPEQVQAVWMEPVDSIYSGTFPSDVTSFQSALEQVIQNLLYFFPNLKVLYLSSRYYGGYSNGIVTDNPEPYAFETGFAVKWAIQAQLSGDPKLNYNPAHGKVVAPWIAWGPYYWSNGLVVPDLGGLVWTCPDLKNDGVHPNQDGAGKEKAANQVLNFLKADPTATPWFLAPIAKGRN